MRFTQTSLLKLIIFIVVGLSIITVPISPLPWFDEVVFSSIAHSFSIGNGFEFTAAPPYLHPERQVYTYGPVYFMVAAISYIVADIDTWNIRLTSIITALSALFILKKSLKFDRYSSLILLLLVLSDLIFTSNSHGGRMDTLAILFWYSGFSIQLSKPSKTYIAAILTGGLFGLGYLTTPRSFMIYSSLAVLIPIFIYSNSNNKKAITQSIIMAATFATMVGSWIIWAFGSISAYQEHYAQLAGTFVGNAPLPPKFQWPLIITVLGLGTYGLLWKRKDFINTFRNPWVSFSLLSIISFYILVFDTGTYSIFIIMLYYALLIIWAKALLAIRAQKFLLGSFLLLNLGLLSAKYTVVLTGQRWEKTAQMESFIKKHVPSNSMLIGDEVYYYGCKKHDVEFQFMDLYLSDSAREAYHREVYDYDYLFVSERLQREKPALINLYQQRSTLTPVDTLHYDGQLLDIPIINILRKKVHNSYDGVLYQRVK